jgi:hypothetical protein
MYKYKCQLRSNANFDFETGSGRLADGITKRSLEKFQKDFGRRSLDGAIRRCLAKRLTSKEELKKH